jgi:hypothetical protein
MSAHLNLEDVSSEFGKRRLGVLTLEVGHVCPDIRVQGVYNHLAVCRSSNLDAPVGQTGRGWCTPPCVILADVLGLWKEVEEVSLVELGLSDHSSLEERFPALVECAVEKGKEDGSIFAEDVTVLVVQLAENVDLTEDSIRIGCHCGGCTISGSIVGLLTVRNVRNAMMYMCEDEGWADGN